MAKTAFEAQRENLWLLDPDAIIVVGYDTKDGKEHPLVNERVLKMKREGFSRPELVASLMAAGQLQPIIVRKNGEKVECVVGRNRVLAAREVKKLLLDAGQDGEFMLRSVQRKNNDVEALAGAVETENNVRYNDDMLTKARSAQDLLNRGKTREKVALDMGMTLEVLDNHLKVLELSPKMQSAVERGVITPTAAATFADMSHEEQDEKIAEAEAAGIIITVPEARRQKKARNNKSGNGKTVSTRGKGVSVSVLRKVFDDETFVEQLDPSAKAILRWIIGEGSHRSVTGLGASLRRVGELDSDD